MPGPTTSEQQLVADRYLLQEPLGRGQMGTVRRARDTLVGRDVAVKTVELPSVLDVGEQAALRGKIVREARSAVGFSIPGAVRVFDVADHDGNPLIVMELVHALTLQQVVERDGPIEPQRAAGIALDVVEILAAAHDQDIVHRHVAPSNVMVPPHAPARLADFGITPYVNDPKLAALGVVGGSPHFFAPEQVSGRGSMAASDLWGLGATLYFALEGRTPFPLAADPRNVLKAIVETPHRPPRRTGDLTALVNDLLSKDPGARPGIEAVREQLAAVAKRPAPATPPGELPDKGGPLDPVVAISRMFSPDPNAPDAWEPLDLNTGAGHVPGMPLPPPWPLPHRRLRKTATVMCTLVILVLLALLVTNGGLGSRDIEQQQEAQGQAPVVATVPTNWNVYNDSVSGFAMSYPPDWSVTRFGSVTRFQDPTSAAYVQVHFDRPLVPNAAEATVGLERQRFPGGASGYHQLRITPTKFANSDAAIWEFTFDEGGQRRHEIDIVFNTSRLGFTLAFNAHEDAWSRFRPVFAGLTSSFSVPL